jgi:hypothetical protein
MNIKPQYIKYDEINSVVYDTIYLEKPMSNLIDFDWKNILQPPPKNTSNKTIDELTFISKSTKNRSKADIELVYNVDQDLDKPFILLLQKYNLTYPQNYIDLFYDIVHPLLINTKSHWNRARPKQLASFYNIDIDVILTDTHHTAAYPSGHTVYTKLVANIIQDLFPKVKQKELDYIVLETARARVLQGVHYPTDNQASLKFSNYVFSKLSPKLRRYYNDSIQRYS